VASQHDSYSDSSDSIPAQAAPKQAAYASSGYDFDRDSIYALIDRAIPFEACLYHQVLPLSLIDNQLRLGMVDLADVSALDYLRKVLAYLHYRLIPQVIPSDLHHQLLSGYLKFKAHQEAIAPVEEATVFFERPLEPLSADEDFDEPPTIFFDRPVTSLEEVEDEPTLSFEKNQAKANPSPKSIQGRETLIVEAPSALNDAEIKPATPTKPATQTKPAPPSLQQFDRSTIIQPIVTEAPKKIPPTIPAALAVPGNALPLLEVNTLQLSTDQLLALTPKELLEALLGRILTNGIGRLYFEHQDTVGRILSSDSGVFQTVIEGLPIATFEGVVAELKNLTALPLTPVQQTLQVEIERLYDKSRLLLRLRLIPKQLEEGKTSSEDATLQILQGSALRFYQQQQVSSLSRDTLSVARQLQRKVEELHRRSHATPPINPDELAVMPELQEVLQSVKTQLIEIERQTNTEIN
jgi:Type II secretion system (T2SS), protein E, N-terminal domain